MNLFDPIQARQSVRAFLTREVEPQKLNALLLAASQAPSAGNLQAYEIHLIRDAATKQALMAAALDQRFMAQAPVVLLYTANATRGAKYGERGAQLYRVQDATLAGPDSPCPL